MAVKPIPDGFHTVTPYLVVKDVPRLMDFLKRAFGAEETECVRRKDGAVMHAEMRVGDSAVMMGEAREGFPPAPAMLYLYVKDCDAAHRMAVLAGGTSVAEPQDMFYGDRSGGVKDPCGNTWFVATRVEDLAPEELAARAEAYHG